MKIVNDHVELSGRPSIRDERAVYKIASAMYKLLRPDGEYDEEVIKLCGDLAVELRNRVRARLHALLPDEYPSQPLTWRLRG